MKMNPIAVVTAVAFAITMTGCCWLGCGSCKQKAPEKCCKSQCGVGVKANVGGSSAGAGVSTSGAHIEAKTGK